MLFFMMVLSLSELSSVQNTILNSNLRLYDSFGEVHHIYNGTLRFRQSDWDNIKHESISLRVASEDDNLDISFERRIVRINPSMIGKKVFVRQNAEQKHAFPCEIVKQDDEYSIVRDIKTGRYLRVQSNLVEYSQEPLSSPIYEVSFYPNMSNISLVITYVINSLRWRARYILRTLSEGETKFQILADIINSSPMYYHSNEIYLMSGDINLAFGNTKSSSLIATPSLSPQSPKTNIDYSGVHLFSYINNSFTVEPYSILTLPIISPNIRVKIFLSFNLLLTIPISSTPINAPQMVTGKHKFQRLYQLSNSSSFLPTGHLLLYDSSSNILTGEWTLPTLAESEKYEFELGQDSDVMFIYNRTISNNQTVTNVLIQNYKQEKVNIRFKSACQSSMICFFYDNKARSLGTRLRYDLALDAKSEVAFTFSTKRQS